MISSLSPSLPFSSNPFTESDSIGAHPQNQRRLSEDADGEQKHERRSRREQCGYVSRCNVHECPGIHVVCDGPEEAEEHGRGQESDGGYLTV